MIDLKKFTITRKAEFEQLARERKLDFEALREKERWTASIYLGPYIVEARLKFKICENLETDRLPAILKTHDLFALAIFAGLRHELDSRPAVLDNFKKIHRFHENVEYRYKIAAASHQADSSNLNDWLFNPHTGVITWLEL